LPSVYILKAVKVPRSECKTCIHCQVEKLSIHALWAADFKTPAAAALFLFFLFLGQHWQKRIKKTFARWLFNFCCPYSINEKSKKLVVLAGVLRRIRCHILQLGNINLNGLQ
jgi:hypothetical protein